MKEMEAQILFEQEYDEYEVVDLMWIYRDIIKHIGFKDRRRDNRFVVKFHDIFYFEPKEFENDEAKENTYNALFEDFCCIEYESVMDFCKENDIDLDRMLTRHDVGHYRAFELDIDEITKENAIELAKKIYDEGLHAEYASDYVKLVNELQDLEDNYMEYWLDFIEGGLPDEDIKQIRKEYEEYKEAHANK